MAEKSITAIVGVLLAIVGLAIISTLVSPNAQTGSIIGAGGGAISQAICKALSPVTGGSCGGTSVSSTITFGGPV